MDFEGSPQEKRIRGYLAALGIDCDALTKGEFIMFQNRIEGAARFCYNKVIKKK